MFKKLFGKNTGNQYVTLAPSQQDDTKKDQALRQLFLDNAAILPTPIDIAPNEKYWEKQIKNRSTKVNGMITLLHQTLKDYQSYETIIKNQKETIKNYNHAQEQNSLNYISSMLAEANVIINSLHPLNELGVTSEELSKKGGLDEQTSLENLIQCNQNIRALILEKIKTSQQDFDEKISTKFTEKSSWVDILTYLEKFKENLRDELRSAPIESLLGTTLVDEQCQTLLEIKTLLDFRSFYSEVKALIKKEVDNCMQLVGNRTFSHSDNSNNVIVSINRAQEYSKKLTNDFFKKIESISHRSFVNPFKEGMEKISTITQDSLADKIKKQTSFIDQCDQVIDETQKVMQKLQVLDQELSKNQKKIDTLTQSTAPEVTDVTNLYEAEKKQLTTMLQTYIERIESDKSRTKSQWGCGFFKVNNIESRIKSYDAARNILEYLKSKDEKLDLSSLDVNNIRSREFKAIAVKATEFRGFK